MKKIILSLFCLWTFFSALAQQEDPQLNQYLRTAADNNPELKARFYSYQAALERAGAAGVMPDPEVTFGYLVYPQQRMPGMTTINAQVMQMLPWFGTLRSRSDELSARAEQAFIRLQEARYELFSELRGKYYGIYQVEKEIELMQQQVELLKSMERITQAGIEGGRRNMSDWLRVRMQVNEMLTKIEDMRDMAKTLKVEFNLLMNRNAAAEVTVPDSLAPATLPQDMDAVLDSILAKNTGILALDADRRATEFSLRSARLEGLPDLGIGLQYMQMQMLTGGTGNMLMPMVSARIPLYRGRYRAMEQEMQYELDMIAAERQGTQNMLRAELEMLRAEFRSAERKIELLQQNVSLSRQAYRILMDRYSVDAAEFDVLLEVLEDLLKYQRQLHQAIAAQNTTLAKLERLMALEIIDL